MEDRLYNAAFTSNESLTRAVLIIQGHISRASPPEKVLDLFEKLASSEPLYVSKVLAFNQRKVDELNYLRTNASADPDISAYLENEELSAYQKIGGPEIREGERKYKLLFESQKIFQAQISEFESAIRSAQDLENMVTRYVRTKALSSLENALKDYDFEVVGILFSRFKHVIDVDAFLIIKEKYLTLYEQMLVEKKRKSEIERAGPRVKATIGESFKSSGKESGNTFRQQSKSSITTEEATCWVCQRLLKSSTHRRCSKCGWFKCDCSSCGCGIV